MGGILIQLFGLFMEFTMYRYLYDKKTKNRTTMKTKLLLLLFVSLIWACGSEYKSKDESVFSPEETAPEYEDPGMEKEVSEAVLNEQAAFGVKKQEGKQKVPPGNKTSNFKNPLEYLADTLYLNSVRLSKKFIKTADLRFKVENVEKTTRTIEWLTLRLGGYIQQSEIRSNDLSNRHIELSGDSIMEVTEYYVNNNMIIRVPNIYFDSTLSEIAKEHIYLNHRQVKTEDVSTIFLRNKLKEEKRTEYEKRIQKAVDKAPRKLDDIVTAERQASELADIAIDKKIDNYKLQDRIDFSTISLNFYQSNDIHKEHVKNNRLRAFQPSFWQRAGKALQVGWKAVLEIIIGLLYLWPIYLIAIGIYYLIKYIRMRMKK